MLSLYSSNNIHYLSQEIKIMIIFKRENYLDLFRLKQFIEYI